jgi:DNA-binding transcriptional MerR regulator
MRIRELAARAGTTTRTLRYYEEHGLLPAARSANGYRAYDENHVRLVQQIKSLRAIGFSLEDVRPFIDCLLAGHQAGDECPASVDVYRRKLEYLDRHIGELTGVRDRLAARLAVITSAPSSSPPAGPSILSAPDFTCRPFGEEAL